MPRSTYLEKIVTDALDFRVTENESALGTLQTALQDKAQQIADLDRTNDSQDSEINSLDQTLTNFINLVIKLNQKFQVNNLAISDGSSIVLDVQSVAGIQVIENEIPAESRTQGVIILNNPSISLKGYSFLFIYKSANNPEHICLINDVEIKPGDRHEVLCDGSDWIVL